MFERGTSQKNEIEVPMKLSPVTSSSSDEETALPGAPTTPQIQTAYPLRSVSQRSSKYFPFS